MIRKIFTWLTLCAATVQASGDVTDFVDVKIGSGGHGHVFVGANVPFGMVQVGPTSLPQEWDWCSGYHESDSTVIGFSHTHLSGTGIGDLFDITIMPVTGRVTYSRGEPGNQESGLWSYADRSREVARPGYYSVPLSRYGVLAEMTATERVGFHRYTFPAGDSAAIVFDLQNGGCWDRTTASEIHAEGNNTVSGYRFSRGWAPDQKVYFVAEFSLPFDSLTVAGDYGRACFSTSAGQDIMVKVALSPVSVEAARRNMATELPGWDFDAVADAALESWNRALSAVRIETADPKVSRIFYTSLYHSMFFPCLFSDCGEPDRYTVMSLWDTYRAQMPLLSIIGGNRYAGIINSMVDIAARQGRLPVWHLWGNETDCMVGNPGVIPVADAIVKKIPGIDRDAAFRALLTTMNDTIRGLGLRKRHGYIPSDLFNESIAYDMEYAIADAAVAAAARSIGDTAVARDFGIRSHSYRNYFDPVTGFIRGRMADGSWRTPFDPLEANHRANDYCEGNAWQYTWLVPHDVDGLASLFGGRETMEQRLDSLFRVSAALTGEDISPDISGLIGQYAHGNEPSHHVPYLYAMMGRPDKTSVLVRRILDTLYDDSPDGICGNEDAGQMSAWYVMSALGFYQPEPASGRYWFGSPLIERAVLTVSGGKFIIEVRRHSPDSSVIDRVWLDGELYSLPYITHSRMMQGGTLIFDLR